jgi:tRNA G18 (ribose-2'-O)-methylase SpoU
MQKLSMDELNRKSVEEFRESEKIPVVVVLENIRSAYNVGSVFRTADAFLLEAIYICGYTATPPHKEIRKTASEQMKLFISENFLMQLTLSRTSNQMDIKFMLLNRQGQYTFASAEN